MIIYACMLKKVCGAVRTLLKTQETKITKTKRNEQMHKSKPPNLP